MKLEKSLERKIEKMISIIEKSKILWKNKFRKIIIKELSFQQTVPMSFQCQDIIQRIFKSSVGCQIILLNTVSIVLENLVYSSVNPIVTYAEIFSVPIV